MEANIRKTKGELRKGQHHNTHDQTSIIWQHGCVTTGLGWGRLLVNEAQVCFAAELSGKGFNHTSKPHTYTRAH